MSGSPRASSSRSWSSSASPASCGSSAIRARRCVRSCAACEEAFQYLRGVARELLFDQLKAVIIDGQRPAAGKVVENPEFLRFAAHWGFCIRACRPGRAQTKGKVERPIRYVRQSCLYGRDFAGDADLSAQTLHWLAAVATVRLHATIKEQPVVRFERDEHAALQPLAGRIAPWS
jgi:transposase